MSLISDELSDYLEKCCEPEPALLEKIDRETQLEVLMPRMLSGHLQGRVLSMLSKMLQPKRILEVGTFTGYATLCFTEGLAPDGKIITLDINEELEDRVRGYFEASDVNDKIDYRIGNAAHIIPTLTDVFDLVFIDADKKNNGLYYDQVFDKVRSGGLIIVDNVLWSGKVTAKNMDQDTSNIINFNDKVTADTSVEKLILPVRDGLFVIRKK
ncbi:O-methyltransferase [Pedobacter cryophilus]|uniref:O-methyltransferase n=1 Tax=Pedobacter cryophilus TaxID=2571271 RepID=A0A4U1C678_9SPHI|nr:O-methyltransferase [Pedobacter cryophilus]TKC00909.1 O-methyltransferase [Pedobacter cryophilus]